LRHGELLLLSSEVMFYHLLLLGELLLTEDLLKRGRRLLIEDCTLLLSEQHRNKLMLEDWLRLVRRKVVFFRLSFDQTMTL
jgi:hypothetical protein